MGRHTIIAFCRAKNVVCFQADDNSWRGKGVCGIDNVLQPTDIGKWVVASHEPSLVTGNNLRENMFELQSENISYDLWFFGLWAKFRAKLGIISLLFL